MFSIQRDVQARSAAAPAANSKVAAAPPNSSAQPTSSSPGGLRLLALLGVVLAAPLTGCTQNYIVNTDVIDTDENRRIVAFCELYRKAVERRDIGMLLELASPEYYDNGGNVDATDDIDFAGLEAYLGEEFSETRAIRYEIRYRRVQRAEDYIYVDYTYSGSFRVSTTGGDKWKSTVEENRLELVADGDSYRIVAGM